MNEEIMRKLEAMYKIEKLKKKVQLLERIEKLKKSASIIESGKKWIRADEGEHVGYDNYYVAIEEITLRSAFLGYGTSKTEVLKFRDALYINELVINGMLDAIAAKIEELQKETDEEEK